MKNTNQYIKIELYDRYFLDIVIKAWETVNLDIN